MHPRVLRIIHRTPLAAVLIAAAFTAQASPALAQAAGSHGMVVQSVTGAAHYVTPDGFFRRFTFTAQKYSDSFVDGQWQMVAGATILHGSVTCLNILSPHEARLGGTIDDAHFALFLPGTDIGWVVVDNGQGADAPPDMTSSLRAFRNAPPGSAEQFCETGQLPFPGGDLGIDNITYGNTQIHP